MINYLFSLEELVSLPFGSRHSALSGSNSISDSDNSET